MRFKASAPGSMVLLGEYAVLYGSKALVCALNKRVHVTLTPRKDDLVKISSDRHGVYQTTLQKLQLEKPFDFVLAALKFHQAQLKSGCDIAIKSDFSDQVGFGSSAAVTVATLAAIVTWLKFQMTSHEFLHQARQVVRNVQQVGSGADVAAAIYGGMVSYQAQPLMAEKLAVTHPISALYCGFKTKTPDAIQQVTSRFARYPELFKYICAVIGQCAKDGIQAVKKQDWTALGSVMTLQQSMMDALGVNLPVLQRMAASLAEQPGMLGAKISGSGLGDCVVGLGEIPVDYVFPSVDHNVSVIPVEMTLQGVQCDQE